MWTKHTSSRTGKTYYFCAATGETRWAQPVHGKVMDAPPPPTVEQHYDVRAVVKRKREDDPDYRARLHNNAVKAQLIETCVPIESTVLDVACGKGGDLLKFAPYIKAYTGIDVSEKSVLEARRRAADDKRFTYMHADASVPLTLTEKYDAVSCMFALHYFYKTEAMLQTLLQNVSQHLIKGGMFFGIMTDAKALRVGAVQALLKDKTTFGNTLFQIAYESKLKTCLTQKTDFGFGVPYVFKLQSGVVECEEYCAPISLLQRLGTEVGLELVVNQNLGSFSLRPDLARAMRVQPLTEEEAEMVAMYTTFIFKKV